MKSDYKSALAHMAASILRPLIKVLMRNEFTHAELTELVRQTYVEVAYNAFSIPDQKMTYSRAAVLTGLSRKEVVRLRENIIKNETLSKRTPYSCSTNQPPACILMTLPDYWVRLSN